MRGEPVEILLVEDNPGDVRLIMEVMKDAKVANKIHVAEDGVEAMEFLRKKGRYADAVHPDIIFLDLNLPRMDGREVLRDIKNDDSLRSIPVVVLTTSSAEQDIVKAYSDYANAYITKPMNLRQFIDVMKAIKNFWLTIVKLPNGTK